jgi:hypothetical protein
VNTAAHRLPGADSPRSPLAGLDVCAETGHRLQPGRCGPVFDDDVWDLSVVDGLPRILLQSSLVWDFTDIGNPSWRTTAKEYLFALLAPGHEQVRILPRAYRVPRTLSTCGLRFRELSLWLNWLTGQGISSLAEVQDEHCQRYLQQRRVQRDEHGNTVRDLSPARHLQVATVVLDLAFYQPLFSTDGYRPGFYPWAGRTATDVVGFRRVGENKTPTIPDTVLRPMLGAALFIVEAIGPQLVALREEMAAYRRARPRWSLLSMSEQLHHTVTDALDELVTCREPLVETCDATVTQRLRQGWSADDPLLKVNFAALGHAAGLVPFRAHWLPHLRPDIERAVAAVGLAPLWARRAASITRAGNAGEVVWAQPMSAREVRSLTCIARTASLLVVAAVSGMRTSELMELNVGCRRTEQGTSDLARYRLVSNIVKGQPLGGTTDEWVVVEQAYHAAGLAEQLADDATGAPLFDRFAFYTRYISFRTWVNGPAGQRLGLEPIPEIRINPRMLRRTLAYELAYRPGGLLAAKIHLKHVSVATTEGYAARPGGAQAKMLAEVAAHEQERNLELVLAEFRNYQNGVLPAGPGAADLIELFDSVDAHLAEQATTAPKTLTSDQETRNLLSKRANVLHLGTANFCWFVDPSRALCLKLAATPTADRPLVGMCDSARCPQATHHSCHRPVWADAVDKTTTFLGALGPTRTTERVRLQAEHARAARVLAEIDAATARQDAP